MLTKEAFNALLKTLEEPPAQVKFFFATTEPHKVPPTILSRCQRIRFRTHSPRCTGQKTLCNRRGFEDPRVNRRSSLIAQLAEGSLRDAESLLDQVLCYGEPPLTLSKTASILGILPHTALYALDQAFAEQNFSFAFELADQIFTSGKEISHFLDTLLEHYPTHSPPQTRHSYPFLHTEGKTSSQPLPHSTRKNSASTSSTTSFTGNNNSLRSPSNGSRSR